FAASDPSPKTSSHQLTPTTQQRIRKRLLIQQAPVTSQKGWAHPAMAVHTYTTEYCYPNQALFVF
ncbi:hypothetical protein ACQP3C_27860, partial [Escherichia coli]